MAGELTIVEMHRGVRLGVQQVDANFVDGFYPEEIDYYLNESIKEFVRNTFDGITIDRKGFEQSQRRIDELAPLYVKDTELDAEYLGSPLDGFHIDQVDLPDNYMYLVSHRSLIQYQRTVSNPWGTTVGSSRTTTGENIVEKKVFNRTAQSDDVYRLLKDPYSTTYHKEPLIDINDNHINVYTNDNFVVKKVIINYIKEPATVKNDTETPGNNVNCDLPGHVHNEIVRNTVGQIIAHVRQLQNA